MAAPRGAGLREARRPPHRPAVGVERATSRACATRGGAGRAPTRSRKDCGGGVVRGVRGHPCRDTWPLSSPRFLEAPMSDRSKPLARSPTLARAALGRRDRHPAAGMLAAGTIAGCSTAEDGNGSGAGGQSVGLERSPGAAGSTGAVGSPGVAGRTGVAAHPALEADPGARERPVPPGRSARRAAPAPPARPALRERPRVARAPWVAPRRAAAAAPPGSTGTAGWRRGGPWRQPPHRHGRRGAGTSGRGGGAAGTTGGGGAALGWRKPPLPATASEIRHSRSGAKRDELDGDKLPMVARIVGDDRCHGCPRLEEVGEDQWHGVAVLAA